MWLTKSRPGVKIAQMFYNVKFPQLAKLTIDKSEQMFYIIYQVDQPIN